jgi:hypothetical protein
MKYHRPELYTLVNGRMLTNGQVGENCIPVTDCRGGSGNLNCVKGALATGECSTGAGDDWR